MDTRKRHPQLLEAGLLLISKVSAKPPRAEGYYINLNFGCKTPSCKFSFFFFTYLISIKCVTSVYKINALSWAFI